METTDTFVLLLNYATRSNPNEVQFEVYPTLERVKERLKVLIEQSATYRTLAFGMGPVLKSYVVCKGIELTEIPQKEKT